MIAIIFCRYFAAVRPLLSNPVLQYSPSIFHLYIRISTVIELTSDLEAKVVKVTLDILTLLFAHEPVVHVNGYNLFSG